MSETALFILSSAFIGFSLGAFFTFLISKGRIQNAFQIEEDRFNQERELLSTDLHQQLDKIRAGLEQTIELYNVAADSVDQRLAIPTNRQIDFTTTQEPRLSVVQGGKAENEEDCDQVEGI